MTRRFFALFRDGFAAIDEAAPRYTVVPHDKSEWGDMFAIVSPKGEVVGLDRYKPAHERCAALNSSGKRK